MITFLTITNLLTLIYAVVRCKQVELNAKLSLEAAFTVLAQHIKPLEEHFMGDLDIEDEIDD